MNILSVITPISFGGGEAQLILKTIELKKLGINVKVLNLAKSFEFEKKLESENINYYTLNNIFIGFSPTQNEYVKLLLKVFLNVFFDKKLGDFVKNNDIVVAHGFPANVFVYLLKKSGVLGKNVKKLIYTHHSVKSPMKGLTRFLYEKILDNYDVIVGVSSKTSESLKKVFPQLKKK